MYGNTKAHFAAAYTEGTTADIVEALACECICCGHWESALTDRVHHSFVFGRPTLFSVWAAMHSGIGTGTRSNAGNVRHDIEVTDSLGSWSGTSRGHSHSQQHECDCRHWETQPGQAQKLRRYAEHVHKYAWQCGTHKNGWEHTKTHQHKPNRPRTA